MADETDETATDRYTERRKRIQFFRPLTLESIRAAVIAAGLERQSCQKPEPEPPEPLRWGRTLAGYNGSCNVLATCPVCWSLVLEGDQSKHEEWHRGNE